MMACAMCCIITVLPDLGEATSKTALAFADRRDDVNDAAGDVFFRFDIAFECEWFIRKQRRQVFKNDLVLALPGGSPLTLSTFTSAKYRSPSFGVRISPSMVSPVCRLKRGSAKGSHKCRRACQIRNVGRTQKSKSVLQHFKRAVTEDRLAFLGVVFQQRKDQFLLAQAVGAFEFGRVGHLDQFGDMFEFEFGQLHGALK